MTNYDIYKRGSDSGKPGSSSLQEFLKVISSSGIQIKSNFEVEVAEIGGFQFFCQSINVPTLKTNTTEIFYGGRSIQIPINCEQEHDFSMNVINDNAGLVYSLLRTIMIDKNINGQIDNGLTFKIKVIGDKIISDNNTSYKLGQQIIFEGVRINTVGGLDFSYSDYTPQTFQVNGYVNFVYFETYEHT